MTGTAVPGFMIRARVDLGLCDGAPMPSVLDLFSGIGGFSLGLERAGFRTVAFCEIDPWCRRVLAKHWPGVPCYADVRELDASRLRADGIGPVDVVCGGFPCQDISLAGKGAGLDGERSGLWREFFRIIGDVRPRFAIVENVGAIRGRGLDRVLGDLASIGFDAEWHAIPAAAIGAPHLRDRVWIVAADADSVRVGRGRAERGSVREACERRPAEIADADDIARRCLGSTERDGSQPEGGAAADADRELGRDGRPARQAGAGSEARRQPVGLGDGVRWSAAADPAGRGSPELRGLFGSLARSLAAAAAPWDWTAESPLRRMDDGISARLDRPRLKALGNAVVPQIPELIGRALLAGETP